MRFRITSQETKMAKATNNTNNSKALFSVRMDLSKTTKGTYVYASVDQAAEVRSVYINKDGMPDGAPKQITLSVTAEE